MNKLNKIKVFVFNKAQYDVEDSLGNRGLLTVNYKKKKYRIHFLNTQLDDASILELSEFANDLLERKHAVNFADPRN